MIIVAQSHCIPATLPQVSSDSVISSCSPSVPFLRSSSTTLIITIIILPHLSFISVQLRKNEPLSVWHKGYSTQNPSESESSEERGEPGCFCWVDFWGDSEFTRCLQIVDNIFFLKEIIFLFFSYSSLHLYCVWFDRLNLNQTKLADTFIIFILLLLCD